MIDEILDALIEAFKADLKLSEIKTYHKVEGMIPDLSPTISVWTPKQRFREYDSNMDETELPIHIGISLHDIEAERGEQRIRTFAEEIRLLLVADQETLGGLIDASFFDTWEFASANSDKGLMLHLGEAIWEVKYYAPRFRDSNGDSIDDITIEENIIIETE